MLKTYAYHKPSEEALGRITTLRECFSTVAALIDSATGPSRERAIAHTKLEEVAMWAIKAVVVNDPLSETEGK